MDNRDLASGSCSETRKKLKSDNEDSTRPSPEKEALNALAKFFVRGGVNPNTIKIPSFTNFIQLLNPNFRPTVSQLEKEVLEIHRECKAKAKEFLERFQGKLTLSYEWMVLGHGWTRDSVKGPVLNEDFVCITAHFVDDDDWKVRKWILGYASEVDVVDPDDLYVHGFRNAVQGFEIDNKISALLLPNDEGFDEETLGGFRRGLEEKGDNNSVFLVYCCADLFRLMVNDVFSDLSGKLLEDLRMLVGWGKCLSENWNLWVSNLQRAVEMRKDDEFSKDEVYDDYDKPSDEEWIKIETFARLVGCVYKVAVELFEGGYSTSNVYFHLLAELKVTLEKEVESAESDYFRCRAEGMLERFDKYWDRMFLVLATASVLDPRFKMNYVEFYCSKKIDGDEGSKAEKTVLDYLRSLYASYAASGICQKPICPVATVDSKEENENDGGGEEEARDEEDGEEDYDEEQEGEEEEDYEDEEEEEGEGNYDSDSSQEAEREARKKREEKPDACKDFAFFQEFLKFEGSSLRELGDSELDAYLKEPVMEWNKDFRALEWWREEGGHKYPVLSRVARDILSIPISRATSYYAYGLERREPPAFVVSLEAEVANAMMCSKRWLRL